MANESAEAVPELQPETQTKPKVDTRPFAEPSTPKVGELPLAPPQGEITVRPKEVPIIPKVDTPKLDLPDAPPTPNAPKIEPPSPKTLFDPTKIIPPIAGATTATVGKLAADKLKRRFSDFCFFFNAKFALKNGVEEKKAQFREVENKWFRSYADDLSIKEDKQCGKTRTKQGVNARHPRLSGGFLPRFSIQLRNSYQFH